jgi:cytochrome c oxidase accessory protein FixG
MTSSGGFRRWRRAAFAAQAALVLGLPFVRVGGESALRFDVPSLTLHAFGAALQIDELFLVLLFLLAATAAFGLATVLLGRVWCGWACPQAVLAEATEPVVPRRARPPKGRAPLGAVAARGVKLCALAAVSTIVAANLLWYFVPPQEFLRRAADGALGPVLGGSWAALAAILFLDLALLRHRFCATVCPYAKLQGALFDRQTLVVAYDARRGAECIDCRACVRACPTGIDIRDGLQTACIACAQCADACGPILARLGRRNLVGYSFGEPGTPRRLVRPGTVAAAALTALALGAAGVAAAGREPFDLSATVAPGSTGRLTPDGRTVNALEIGLTNRGPRALDVALDLTAGGAPATLQPARVTLAPGEHRQVRVLAAVRLPAERGAVAAELSAQAEGRRMTRALTFVPPEKGEGR